MSNVVRKKGGISFKAGADSARLIVSANDTEGRYSLLEWTIAAGKKLAATDERDYGPHLHSRYEETFLIQSGELEFLLGDEIMTLCSGDFVRVPAGIHHGYQNASGKPVSMLVGFTPGGLEELFLKYRSDQEETTGPGFVSDATQYHSSVFGLPPP